MLFSSLPPLARSDPAYSRPTTSMDSIRSQRMLSSPISGEDHSKFNNKRPVTAQLATSIQNAHLTRPGSPFRDADSPVRPPSRVYSVSEKWDNHPLNSEVAGFSTWIQRRKALPHGGQQIKLLQESQKIEALLLKKKRKKLKYKPPAVTVERLQRPPAEVRWLDKRLLGNFDQNWQEAAKNLATEIFEQLDTDKSGIVDISQVEAVIHFLGNMDRNVAHSVVTSNCSRGGTVSCDQLLKILITSGVADRLVGPAGLPSTKALPPSAWAVVKEFGKAHRCRRELSMMIVQVLDGDGSGGLEPEEISQAFGQLDAHDRKRLGEIVQDLEHVDDELDVEGFVYLLSGFNKDPGDLQLPTPPPPIVTRKRSTVNMLSIK